MTAFNLETYLKNWFGFPQNRVYCQVSTSRQNNPHLRTMALYHLSDSGELIFLTDTSTPKWQDLNANPQIAVCMVNTDLGQILVEGEAQLKTRTKDPETARFYWDHCLDAYWREHYLTKTPSNDLPASFGVISIVPHFYDILVLNKKDFLKSKRTQFHLIENNWVEKEVESV